MAKEIYKVEVDLREKFGKGAARKLRVLGMIPAVIYGHGTEPVHVSLPAHRMGLLLRRANSILDLDINGKSQRVLVKDVQKDPVLAIVEHIDLIVVRTGEKVQVEVQVHMTGETAPGTIGGFDTKTLLLEVEATDIPENVTVSVEGLEDGAQIHASDIILPDGAELISEPDTLVVVVSTPRGEGDAETEVITAGTPAA
ncbi:50S ribosomal protein L25/general stress protein Ctc [Cryobacterium psychrophilum]|uniref:Large ribosomal subunit protein bL25 n=1 Tax=Cryobacterium psychrophilum TaxID=41988 RepID=A0A4Y8KM76_9MICO|nr:50S ribosomal protein L25/general stress protein Ctc [Cryobacterium psychrophilum]TDW30793.1 LSU ribosomal protein L25P [Cryobacterium psychrophilum]TFD75810.1 50S ribosomal protein L25/general stress protein Ctc [Cryobacterium psychrophilum]